MTSVLRLFWARRTRRHYRHEEESARRDNVLAISATEKRLERHAEEPHKAIVCSRRVYWLS